MFRKILFYGVIAGLVAIVPMSLMIVMPNHESGGVWSMVVGYLTMLIALTAVFMGVKRHRDVDRGGVIRFWPALGLGLAISVVAGVIYVAGWEFTMAVTHMDFAGSYARAQIAEQVAHGLSGAALAKFTAEMDAFKAQYANPLYRWSETFLEIFPVGVVVSLISAALLCNPKVLPMRRG